ncbi:hypothetical protein Fcan01_25807 [Folsomia candida]|uniref:Uncharacterized protein n=1 Tax=Folsomia candida TaxID=158441 RepID=A0A226D4A3_FOLCA|nr:hypothetical protein Fcan01_25807 [Folsomia candida]
MVGVVLHGLILAALTFPTFAPIIPILLDNADPTYFLLRNVNFLPSHLKLMVRILLTIAIVSQLSIAGIGFVIIFSNVLLLMAISFRSITPLNPCKSEFFEFFPPYRQLQIINRVWNNTCYLATSFALFFPLALGVLLGYTLIKLSCTISIPMTFIFAALFLGGVSIAHFTVPVMVEITIRSRDFKRTWKSCSLSAYGEKQIKSCDTLRVYLGGFCVVSEKSRGIFFSMVMYYTLSLIIAL